MTASSLSTYLDVTRAARGTDAAVPSAGETDVDSTAQAAKVLAALHTGTEIVMELSDQTGLEPSQVLAVLAWLSDAGMVELEDQAGVLRARLTKPVEAALSGA